MQLFDTKHFIKLDGQDYLLVITPSEEVISKVISYKSYVQKKIGFFPSFNSKAHITVNHYFDGNAVYFDQRAPIYRSMTSQINSFEIKINGFDFFKHNGIYTIYAKVDLDQIITSRFKRFKKVFGSDVPQTPHITIARGLTHARFEILWHHFKNQKFECSFYADEIVVLKTPNRRFCHSPMEVETKFELRKVI